MSFAATKPILKLAQDMAGGSDLGVTCGTGSLAELGNSSMTAG